MMLLDFLYLFIASALLGMLFGLVCAYCLRTFHFHHVSQVRAGHTVRRALLAAGRVAGQSTMLGPALMAWLASMLHCCSPCQGRAHQAAGRRCGFH